MKFSEMPYIRPNVDEVRAELDKVAEALETVKKTIADMFAAIDAKVPELY